MFPGEAEAIDATLAAGERYGFGNLIAHLKRAWAERLMARYGMTETEALRGADTDAAPAAPKAGAPRL